MGEVDTRAKPLCLSQPVGLLALLSDFGSAPRPVCDKQKLFRHVSYSQNCGCLFHLVSQSAKISESSETSRMPSPEKVLPRVMKKVRFAPDVVEPRGDSRAYRGRKDVNQVIQTKAYDEERQGHVESVKKDDDTPSSGISSCHSHNCRKMARPNLPANRMLLYKGMQCYKAKMMPCL